MKRKLLGLFVRRMLMTLSNGTHIIRRGTCGSRITTLPVAALLIFAINIGLMLVPGVESAELSSTPTENTWVTNGTVNAIVSANGVTYIGGSFT